MWSWGRLVLGLAGLAACGRLRFEERPALADANADAPLGPFEAPRRIVELSDPTTRDDDPSATADLLEIYFNSARAGGPGNEDVWVATRATPDASWGPPSLVAELSSPALETGPKVSADGLTFFLASDRAGSLGATDIWMSTRSSRAAAWGAPVHVPELSSSADDTAPAVHASGLMIMFESTREGDASLYIATRASTSASWQAPVRLDVSTSDHEGSPYVTADGHSLLYNATRPSTLGMADIYIATRAADDEPFSNETRVEVSSTQNDEDPWLSADGRLLLFASNRTGDLELYEARR